MERINELEKEIAELKKTLYKKEREIFELKSQCIPLSMKPSDGVPKTSNSNEEAHRRLPKWAIERYSRQILLPEISAYGQQRLMSSRVLVVGAGGLGCPAAMYLAGAGVGTIGIVDYDSVDLTNIHRQVLHGESDQDMRKVESAVMSLKNINSNITVVPYDLQLDSSNALEIISKYDVVLDCTDNVPTRYLLNDACIMKKVPLISGSALKLDGQITTYGYIADKNSNEKDPTYSGPCYRCVFPTPPPPEAVGSCSANGVAGPVPGIIGTLQALEAIKYLIGNTKDKLLVERMILFDGDDMTFRTVKLRPKDAKCAICSSEPIITELVDYEVLCKTKAVEKDLDLHILSEENRISPKELAAILKCEDKHRHLLVDVRNYQEFHMCRIDGAINYPIEEFGDEKVDELVNDVRNGDEITFICRRGNDSQLAAQKLLELLDDQLRKNVKDLTGGLHAWAKDVDSDFPVY